MIKKIKDNSNEMLSSPDPTLNPDLTTNTSQEVIRTVNEVSKPKARLKVKYPQVINADIHRPCKSGLALGAPIKKSTEE
jgi:hypothetical protein